MNLKEFAQAVETTTAKIDVSAIEFQVAGHTTITYRSELAKLQEQLLNATRALEDKKAALLLSGAIQGKNAELREADLRVQLKDERELVELIELGILTNKTYLENAEAEARVHAKMLEASMSYLHFLASPGAMIIAVEAEKVAYEQAIMSNLDHLQKEVENQVAENGNADLGTGTEGVFVHIMERDEHDEGEQDLFARPPYRPEHNDE